MKVFLGAVRWAGALALAAGAPAEEVWLPEALEGLEVTALAATPAAPGLLYAGTAAGRVFRSEGAGAAWVEASTGLPAAAVRALAADPGDAGLVYAGTDQGLFRSGDSGATWSPAGSGMEGGPVHSIAIDPADPAVVWASADEPGLLHVYRSADGGDAWKTVVLRGSTFGTPSNFGYVRSLVVRPGTSRIYAGWHEIVFWSDDAGESWSKYPDVNLEVTAVLLDAFDAAVVYAGTIGGGVARSVNTAPWTFGAGLSGATVGALVADPSASGLLYASNRAGGVFRSRDGGGSWLPAAALNLPAGPLAFRSADGALFAGTTGGIYRLGTPPPPSSRMPVVGPRPRRAAIPISPRD